MTTILGKPRNLSCHNRVVEGENDARWPCQRHEEHAQYQLVRRNFRGRNAPLAIAPERTARYIGDMDSRSNMIRSTTARLIAILSLGLLLRAART